MFRWTENTHPPSHPRLQILNLTFTREYKLKYKGSRVIVMQDLLFCQSSYLPWWLLSRETVSGNPARFFPPVSTWQRITEWNPDDKQLALAALARKFLCAWLSGYLPVNFHITDGKITIFNGKIHYFYGHFQ